MGNVSSNANERRVVNTRVPEVHKVIVVPEGHKVIVHPSSPFSYVEQLDGGTLVAHFGIAGINRGDDIKEFFQQVQSHLHEQQSTFRQKTLLFLPDNGGKLSDIFAPHDPKLPTEAFLTSVVWTGFIRIDCATNKAGRPHTMSCVQMSIEKLSQWLLQIKVPHVLNVYMAMSEPAYLQPGLGALGWHKEGSLLAVKEEIIDY